MIILIIIIVFYSLYKIKKNIDFNNQSKRFYDDFDSIANRYSHLYYYFNCLKTLIIFSEEDPRWKIMLNILKDMNKNLEHSNYNYNDVLTHKMSSYKEVGNLLDLLQYNKNDSSEYIKEKLCSNYSNCHEYMNSSDNIFKSGIDSGYKTCFTYMDNIVMDYQKLNNKTNISEIISTISGPNFFEFRRIRKSFTNVFYFIQRIIYKSFEADQLEFRKNYRKIINFLNIISVLFSIITFLFVFIVIFFTVYNFGRTIKDSTYRINQSFYYIKKYERPSNIKRESIVIN